MVGPFMQGMLLMGVIYWYSKGMFNMINEYYRTEFQKQLETSPISRKSAEVDEIELLLIKQTKESQESFLEYDVLKNDFFDINQKPGVCFNDAELQRFLGLALLVCFGNNSNS